MGLCRRQGDGGWATTADEPRRRASLVSAAVLAAMAVFPGASPTSAENPPLAYGQRPFIVVADPTHGCPGIEGRFVALLGPDGASLLSGAPFPGSRDADRSDGGYVVVTSPSGSTRQVTAISSAGRAGAVRTASYSLGTGGIHGCVAFDKTNFSSEGDLVTYLQWLIGEVYMSLPENERPAAFRLSDRQLVLTVRQVGFMPMEVTGTEGSTLAFRLHGAEDIHLARPFVLDPEIPRIALQLARSDQLFWRETEKNSSHFVILTGKDEYELSGATLTVAIGDEPASGTTAGVPTRP